MKMFNSKLKCLQNQENKNLSLCFFLRYNFQAKLFFEQQEQKTTKKREKQTIKIFMRV
jgi:hypothetical protein